MFGAKFLFPSKHILLFAVSFSISSAGFKSIPVINSTGLMTLEKLAMTNRYLPSHFVFLHSIWK